MDVHFIHSFPASKSTEPNGAEWGRVRADWFGWLDGQVGSDEREARSFGSCDREAGLWL